MKQRTFGKVWIGVMAGWCAIVMNGFSHDNPLRNGVVNMSFSKNGVVQTSERSSLKERMTHYNVPGVDVTCVDQYSIQWTHSEGVLSTESQNPVQENAIFQAGSVSKFVTAILVMMYVEQGVLDLDADINTYLSSWKMPENEYHKKITLRMLLSHQSGLPGTNFSRDENAPLPTLSHILSAEPPAKNKKTVPEFSPGTRWSYSNIGYVVIQQIMEDITGKPFNKIASENIFIPLKMTSTTFDYPVPESLKSREAMPHNKGEQKPVQQDSLARAQGGLMTSTQDMARLVVDFMRAYSGKSSAVVTQKMAHTMMKEQVSVPESFFGIPLGMGLGVFLEKKASSISFLHPGHTSPGSAFLIVGYPETGQASVMGLNGNKGDRLALEILAALAQDYGFPGGQFFKKSHKKAYLDKPGTYRIKHDNRSVTIPFDMYGMNIMIAGKCHNIDIHLLIDNGVMWNDLWFYSTALCEKLEISLEGNIDIDGAGEGDGLQSYSVSRLPIVTIGDIEFYNQSAIVTPEEQGIAKMFKGVDGQISGTLFNHFVVAFDFDTQEITLTRPNDFTPPDDAVKLTMTDNAVGSFSIPVELELNSGTVLKENMFIDLGGIYPVSLVIDESKGIHSPDVEKKYLAHGASGPIYGYKSSLKTVRFRKYVLDTVETTFIESKTGGDHTNMTVGLPLLMNFNVIFDYFNKVIYLKPNKRFNHTSDILKKFQ